MLQISRKEKAEMAKRAEIAKTAKIAVLVPCMNEELTIAAVVKNFRKALPNCVVYVYDNNSTDRTAEVAEKAGATLCVRAFSPVLWHGGAPKWQNEIKRRHRGRC